MTIPAKYRAATALGVFAAAFSFESAVQAQTFEAVTNLPPGDDAYSFAAFDHELLYGVQHFTSGDSSLRATDGKTSVTLYSDFGSFSPIGTVGTRFLFRDFETVVSTSGAADSGSPVFDVPYWSRITRVAPDAFWISATTEQKGKTWSLRRSDGTLQGTAQVLLLQGDNLFEPLFAALGAKTFIALRAPLGSVDNGLWVHEGTTATRLVTAKDISRVETCGSRVYFYSEDKLQGKPAGWWVTEGTTASTVFIGGRLVHHGCLNGQFASADWDSLLITTPSGVITSIPLPDGRGVIWLWPSGGRLFVGAAFKNDGTVLESYELYASNGKASGTLPLLETETALEPMLSTPTGALLLQDKQGHVTLTDGTVSGTIAVPGLTVDLGNDATATAGKNVYFWGTDVLHGREPWVSDGTPAGTHELADLRPGAEGSSSVAHANGQGFFVVDGRLFTCADDGTHGRQVVAMSVAPPSLDTPDGGDQTPGKADPPSTPSLDAGANGSASGDGDGGNRSGACAIAPPTALSSAGGLAPALVSLIVLTVRRRSKRSSSAGRRSTSPSS